MLWTRISHEKDDVAVFIATDSSRYTILLPLALVCSVMLRAATRDSHVEYAYYVNVCPMQERVQHEP